MGRMTVSERLWTMLENTRVPALGRLPIFPDMSAHLVVDRIKHTGKVAHNAAHQHFFQPGGDCIQQKIHTVLPPFRPSRICGAKVWVFLVRGLAEPSPSIATPPPTISCFMPWLGTRVVVAVTFQQVDNAPDTETGTQRDNEGLKNGDCLLKNSINLLAGIF